MPARPSPLLLSAALVAGVGGGAGAAAEIERGVPQAVPRVRGLSPEAFERLALQGRPFVIEDGGAGDRFVGWTCDRFRREFPQARVQLQYASDAAATKPITGPWEGHLHRLQKVDPGGPEYAPWYWGVKGAFEEDEAASIFAQDAENPLPKVQSLMRLPSFLSRTRANQEEALGSPEFWFSAPQAGAAMHMDMHCESTLATQLSGTRRWRLGWTPTVPNSTMFKLGAFGDGAVYGKGYVPPLEATVSEGETLFIPSGYLHETANIGEACAVSLTYQIKDPIPAGYLRRSLRHLLRTSDFQECWGMMAQVAGAGGKSKPSLQSLSAGRGRLGRAARAFYDADGDGAVSQEELEDGWAAWRAAVAEVKAPGVKRLLPQSFPDDLSAGRAEL